MLHDVVVKSLAVAVHHVERELHVTPYSGVGQLNCKMLSYLIGHIYHGPNISRTKYFTDIIIHAHDHPKNCENCW